MLELMAAEAEVGVCRGSFALLALAMAATVQAAQVRGAMLQAEAQVVVLVYQVQATAPPVLSLSSLYRDDH
jgi:hypothetical protein